MLPVEGLVAKRKTRWLLFNRGIESLKIILIED